MKNLSKQYGFIPTKKIKPKEVTIHKFGRRFFLYDESGTEQGCPNIDPGFSSKSAAEKYAILMRWKVVNIFSYK